MSSSDLVAKRSPKCQLVIDGIIYGLFDQFSYLSQDRFSRLLMLTGSKPTEKV